MLETIVDISLSDKDFPPYSLLQFYIGHAPVFAQRLSFTGEMGWEIFITPDFAEYVFEQLYQAGQTFGLRGGMGFHLEGGRLQEAMTAYKAAIALRPEQAGGWQQPPRTTL